jgi:hypothetical protein
VAMRTFADVGRVLPEGAMLTISAEQMAHFRAEALSRFERELAEHALTFSPRHAASHRRAGHTIGHQEHEIHHNFRHDASASAPRRLAPPYWAVGLSGPSALLDQLIQRRSRIMMV